MSLSVRMRKGAPWETGGADQCGVDHEEREDPTPVRRLGQRGMILKAQVAAKPEDGHGPVHWPSKITFSTPRHVDSEPFLWLRRQRRCR